MPQNSSYRRDFASQRNLAEAELYRLYGLDYDEMRWVTETLARLKIRRFSLDFSEQDEADLRRVGYILDRRKVLANFMFDPAQPRDSHGRWTALNVAVAVAQLRSQAKKEPPKRGEGECAKYVRLALAAGGVVLGDHPVSAKGFGDALEAVGFDKVAGAAEGQGFPPKNYEGNNVYSPEAGDVVIIQPTSPDGPGHMAMFDGKQWISDFKQKQFWPGSAYVDRQPSYVIYRHGNRK